MKVLQKTTRVAKVLAGAALATLLYSHSTLPTFAANLELINEDFMEQLSSDWKVVWNRQWPAENLPCMNQGTPAEWKVFDGHLGIEIDGPHCVIDLAPTQVNLKNVKKYTAEFNIVFRNSRFMDRSFAFLWQDPKNWYDLKFFGDTLTLQKVVDGKAYTLANSTTHFVFQSNQGSDITIEVEQNKRIVVKVGNHVALDVTDQAPFLTENTAKTVAFRGTVGDMSRSVVLFEHLKLTDLSDVDITLNAPLLKQGDSRWAEDEYDSAKDWAPIGTETIRRWGCAITSMAMILNHYGITTLPDDKALTPGSLNTWLKDQPDGYFGGNLNWLAVTRLTQLISEKSGTVKLELTRRSATTEEVITEAKKEIAAQKPVILGNGGHFFVADGISNTDDTLFIKDPAFTYTKLSQHKTAPITIRKFQPSHTDLSYIMAIVPKGLNVEVKNAAGQTVEVERSDDMLLDAVDGTTQSPAIETILIRKPDTGNYQFLISQPESKPYQLQIYNYDVAGNVSTTEKSGTVGAIPETITLEYKKEVAEVSPSPSPATTPETSPSPESSPLATSIVSPQPSASPVLQQTTWLKFQQDVKLLVKLKQFEKAFVGKYIYTLAGFAIEAPEAQRPMYARAIELGMKIYRSFIKPAAYKYMNQQLKSLKGQTEKPKDSPKN